MIARVWTGAVRKTDADEYAEYMRETGLREYRETAGNRGAWMLRRGVGEDTEFMMFTLWDSIEAVKAFAGDDPDRAVFYPKDDRFLVRRDLEVVHYEVDGLLPPR
ncbi:MAG: antibiotic biosynthesis monooxygenase family protein [Gemmatimonadota bacterium]